MSLTTKGVDRGVWGVIGLGLLIIVVSVGIGLQQASTAGTAKKIESGGENEPVGIISGIQVISPTISTGEFKEVSTVELSTHSAITENELKLSPTKGSAIVSDRQTSEPVQSTPQPTAKAGMVRATGNVVMEGYRVDYWVEFPIDGGGMSGRGSGACEGAIMGTFDIDSRNAGGSMEGTCIIEGESIAATGTFSGKVNLEAGEGNGTWEGKDEAENQLEGEWDFIFEPIE